MDSKQSFSRKPLSVSVLAVGCVAPFLFAETARAENTRLENEAPPVEELIVTAQKREQSLRDVPITITAYTGDFLEQLGIAELDALSDITPGLVIQEQSPNNPGFVIRGITSDSGLAQAAPRVSVYYNGVDISRARGAYFEMFDIERVEVVKGPQATLFGTAASIGAISVLTRRPEREFAAQVSAELGNYDSRQTKGFITGGSDVVQGRLAFSYREREGYIDNIAGQDDLNGIERVAVRPSVRITARGDLTIDLVYNYEKNEDTGTAFKSGLLTPTGGNTSPFSPAELRGSPFSREVFGEDKLGIEREVNDFNITLGWQVSEAVTLTSISGWREFEALEVFDADGSQAWFLEFAEDAEGEQVSQEFRFHYNGERFQVIAGFNYFHEDGSQRVPFSTEEGTFVVCVTNPAACINPDGSVNSASGGQLPYRLEFTNTGDNESYSIFTDGTYALDDRWELTAGLRYVYERRESGFLALAPNSVLQALQGIHQPLLPVVNTDNREVSASDSFDAWLPRFNVRYALSDTVNLYGTVSKGQRSDVIEVVATLDGQGQPAADVTEVPAEKIWNIETGLKGRTDNGRFDYMASVFYQDYENFQVQVSDGAGGFVTENAGNASNAGVEAELRANLTENFNLFANLAYIDATIDEGSDNGEFAGNRFRLQPEWTSALGFSYERPLLSGLKAFASGVWTYRSEVFFEEENKPIAGLAIEEGKVNLVNVRAGFGAEDNSWSVSLFASNLFDEEYVIDAGNTGGDFGVPTFVAGPPRFYGVEFTKHFAM